MINSKKVIGDSPPSYLNGEEYWVDLIYFIGKCRGMGSKEDKSEYLWFSSSRCGVKLQKSFPQIVINLHDRRLISTSITVVWSTENCNHIHHMWPIVPLRDNRINWNALIEELKISMLEFNLHPLPIDALWISDLIRFYDWTFQKYLNQRCILLP